MVTTDEVLAVVARSPHNWGSGRTAWLESELAKLEASPEELAAAALPALDDPDRNVRTRAVWVLGVLPEGGATEGIRRALADPSRRVREVSMKCVRPHHASPEVIAALQSIADDERETNRLRRNAFFTLSSLAIGDAVPDVGEETLRSMMESERFRSPILVRLCTTSNHSPAARAVLQEFVRTGSKEEAVMATRALCGQRLLRSDGFLPPDVRQRVRDTYDPGPDVYFGVSFCWVPGPEADALVEEVLRLRANEP